MAKIILCNNIMASTRIRNDPYRIETQLQDSTFAERRMFNTPATTLHFMNDPHIRMQKWGANKANNFIDTESNLRGMSQKLQYKDNMNVEYKKNSVSPQIPYNQFATLTHAITDESRATHPAYLSKTMTFDRWEMPLQDPRDKAIIPFNVLEETRFKQKEEKTKFRS